MINIGTVIDERYEILKEIGRGGMSIVYLAADDRLNKSVAVKDIRKDNKINNDVLLECLKAEADLMTALDHTNLPKIYDIIEGNNHIYVVMDYIEGESLKKKLDREGKFSPEQVIDWAKQLSDVLDYLHTRKPRIIYRDMKPHNIMLTPEGKIKLIDFGISIRQNGKSTHNFGTSAYAAPEQNLRKNVDTRADIYSLGVTMYQLLTGESFKSNLNLKPIREIDPSYPEGLEQIISKCMKENPNERYQSASELLYDLENINKLSSSYKKEQIKKMGLFLGSLGALILSLIFTIVMHSGMKDVQSFNYKDLINQANVYYLNKDYPKSVELLEKAITEVDPSEGEGYINLLDVYSDMGDASTGLAKVDGYIKKKNGNIQKNDAVLFKTAMIYLQNKNYPLALKYFKMVNEKKIEDAKYYIPIAESMTIMNIDYSEFEHKIISFERYVDNSPNDEKKLANYKTLTSIYSSYKGQINDANDKIIEIIEKAEQTLQNMDDNTLNLRYGLDYKQKAADAYNSKASKSVDKQTASSYYESAINLYNEALDLDAIGQDEILIKIGDICTATEEYSSAIEYYTKVVKEYPNNIKGYSKLIGVLLDVEQKKDTSLRNYSEILSYYNQALNINGSVDSDDLKKVKRRMNNLQII